MAFSKRSRRSRRGLVALVAGAAVAAGAAVQYLLDPVRGRTRRSRLTQQLPALLRRPARRAEDRAEKLTTRARDRAEGLVHQATRSEESLQPETDRALVDKVRSEVLGAERWQDETVNVNAVDGVVTLRGQLNSPEDIRELCDQVAEVPGVRSVESFLHPPNTPAPSVADVFEASRSG